MFKKEKTKTVAELVSTFTGEFQKVSDAQNDIAEEQAEIIVQAENTRLNAVAEKTAADKFIKNFTDLAK